MILTGKGEHTQFSRGERATNLRRKIGILQREESQECSDYKSFAGIKEPFIVEI